jgi:2-methylisocitrate lyase-like PEP mutase family enzyme
MGSVAAALSHLKTDGSVNAVLDKMQTRAQLYQAVGYTPGTPWEARTR